MTRTVFVSCILLAACTPDDTTIDVATDPTDPAGVDAVVVHVPEGAVDGPFEVTVVLADAASLPSPGDLASPIFELGPSPTTFAIPVTVGLPIDPDTPAGTALDVVVYDRETGAWETLPSASIVDGLAFATTLHFSPFAVVPSPLPPGCDNLWGGGPGQVAPLLTPRNVAVRPAVRVDDVVAYSGDKPIELGSTWVTEACDVEVSGVMGDGVAGDGGWVDWRSGDTGSIPLQNGFFRVDLSVRAPNGPYYGLSDPCHAPDGVYPYNLTIEVAADCVDLCEGVTCGADDGNPCTVDTCDPATGQCEQAPAAGTCGDTGAGECVQGLCMMEVVMDGTVDGRDVCAAEGLVCDEAPTLDPVEEACLAFNPTATVSSDVNGWSQSVYCDDNDGKACEGRVNDCHSCPACNPGISCTLRGSDLVERIYVSCVP